MCADADVVKYRQVREQSDILKRPTNADFRDPVRWTREDAHAFHQDVTRARLVEPRQAIEQSCLAGAIWPDQTKNLPLAHLERNAVQRDDATEHDLDVTDGEKIAWYGEHLCRLDC
jgi:hypothetical protein